MCGISGFLHFDPERHAEAATLKRMTDAIEHRGPDAEGQYVRGSVGLGNRRLAIIDLEGGDQPMASADGEVVITFNGEIYNHVELRARLEGLGHRFVSSSDTEVLLAAWRQWGTQMHRELNGMWAFAIWDNRQRRLFLSRDRLGEKPLHYANFDDSFVFGSELKCLLAYGMPKAPNVELTEVYLTLGYVPAPYTYFEGIHKLEAGEYMLVENGKVVRHRYWDLPQVDPRDMIADRAAVNERFEHLLRDSVRLRMRSDVPFGAFLSGGLDSSSIVALMSEIQSRPTATFTIGFEDPAFDERALAALVAGRFGTNHHTEEIRPESFTATLDAVDRAYDEPFGDSSAIPTGFVSEHARRHVKMVLTGDGGDEVLSGYNAYQTEKILPGYNRLPRLLRAMPPRMLGIAARCAPGHLGFRLKRLQGVAHNAALAFEQRLLSKTARADPALIRSLLPSLAGRSMPVEEFLGDAMKGCSYTDGFYRQMYFNLKISLPDKMLVKVDRMSMAHSLEVRTPFLDHRLVEYMCTVAKGVKMRRFERKSVLRDTLAKKLPGALLRAPKRGFGVPLYRWFRDGEFGDRARALTAAAAVPFEPAVVRELVEANASGKRDFGVFLWMLLVLDRWHR